jgi:hypothetical protein
VVIRAVSPVGMADEDWAGYAARLTRRDMDMALAYGRGRSLIRRNRIWRGSRRNKLTALRTFLPSEEGPYLGLCSTWLECGLEE